jgi:anhydro-N-acetylmuramic acid kinase
MALNTVAGWVDKEYDKNGALASRGAIDKSLLNELNSLAYYKRDYPKSLGKEWFLHEFLPVIRKRRISIEDLLRTLCEHIAFQITEFTKKYKSADSRILLTGGGTHNLFLTLLLKESAGCEIVIPSSELINYKEAIVFAYLGFLRMANKVNVLSSVTGASSNTSAGIVYLPNA